MKGTEFKITRSGILGLIIIIVSFLPAVVWGAPDTGLVNCTSDCGWVEFIDLVNTLISWFIGLATIIATLLFIYAGFLYLTAQGNQSQAQQAMGIFTNVAIGFIIILIAWLIVSTVVTLLTTEEWRDQNEGVLPINFSYEMTDIELQSIA